MSARKFAATATAGALFLGACAERPGTTAPAVEAASLAVSGPTSLVARKHVFTLDDAAGGESIAQAVAAAGGTIRYSMDEIGVVLVDGLSDAAAERIAGTTARVASDISAQWIPSVQEMSVRTLDVATLASVETMGVAGPLKAYFGPLQWNMRVTDTDDAWARAYTGSPNVRVAILDTGLDAYHIDFRGVIDWRNSVAFVESERGPPAWEDDHYHGSHVGGIISTSNFGVAGVAPNVRLVAVKVLDDQGLGTVGNIIAGIYYAANLGVDVINLSLGATVPKNEAQGLVPAFNRAVNYAHSRGVFIVAASGNDGQDIQRDGNRVTFPCETGVLTCISATGPTDELAYYSNYGSNAINNAAPGGDFLKGSPILPPGPTFAQLAERLVFSVCTSRSTHPVLSRHCAAGNSPYGAAYIFAEGTSSAAPHVAGLGALLDSQFAGELNGSQIITAIQQNADDRGKPGTDPYYGKGRINTCRTLPGCIPGSPGR